MPQILMIDGRWNFFQGQLVGPTKEVVSDLNQLLGTTVRNPRFVTLLYTSWHGVPKKLKEDIWEYVNQKFVLPISSKPWIMRALCCAWKKYKWQNKNRTFLEVQHKERNDKEPTIRDSRGSILQTNSVLESSGYQGHLC
ncbi:hypothetical protein HN873_038787 [Arachis hypogaea]